MNRKTPAETVIKEINNNSNNNNNNNRGSFLLMVLWDCATAGFFFLTELTIIRSQLKKNYQCPFFMGGWRVGILEKATMKIVI